MPRGYHTAPLGSLDILGPLYSVRVLRVGYNRPGADGSCRADGSVTLVWGGALTVLVDTGGPWLRPQLPGLLGEHGVSPEDVTHVIVTHGHSDHAGNLNLFPRATLLVGFDLSRGEGLYLPHGLASGAALELHPGHLWVTPTPGHTRAHVSLLAAGTALGTVAVAGDAFEHSEDEEEWEALSEDPAEQRRSRRALVAVADVIVPGHGEPFRVLRERAQCREEGEEEEEEGRSSRCGHEEEEEEEEEGRSSRCGHHEEEEEEEEEGRSSRCGHNKEEKEEKKEEKKKEEEEEEEEGVTFGCGDEEEEGDTSRCGHNEEKVKEDEGVTPGHGDKEEEEEEEDVTSGHGDKAKKKKEEDEVVTPGWGQQPGGGGR